MKLAISLPDPIYKAADRYAKERGVPRSQLVAEALEAYLAEHGPEAITARLDRVYSTQDSTLDESLIRAQAAVLDAVDDDEAW